MECSSKFSLRDNECTLPDAGCLYHLPDDTCLVCDPEINYTYPNTHPAY